MSNTSYLHFADQLMAAYARNRPKEDSLLGSEWWRSLTDEKIDELFEHDPATEMEGTAFWDVSPRIHRRARLGFIGGYICGLQWPDIWEPGTPGGPFAYDPITREICAAWLRGWKCGNQRKHDLGQHNAPRSEASSNRYNRIMRHHQATGQIDLR